MAKRMSAQDYRETAKESEQKYQEDSPKRFWNREVSISPKPLYLIILGLAITVGICYKVGDKLDSMVPTFETITAEVIDKRYDETLPSYVLNAKKIENKNEKPIILWNKNSNLERKLNASEIDKLIQPGKKYSLKVSRSRNYPDNVYGNILEIK